MDTIYSVIDTSNKGFHGVSREVSAARGRLRMSLPKQFSDHRLPFAKRQCPARKALSNRIRWR